MKSKDKNTAAVMLGKKRWIDKTYEERLKHSNLMNAAKKKNKKYAKRKMD